MTAIGTTMRIFLTDYASYNNGTQFEFGHWVDLDNFDDAEELMDYISKHFKEADKKSPLDEFGSVREEIMITDYEGFPESLYSEAMSENEFEQLFKYKELMESGDIPEEDDTNGWISLHNEWCSETNREETIYDNDEEFFNMFFNGKVNEAVRATQYGSYEYSDAYVVFNGLGNLDTYDTYNVVEELIDKEELIEWKLESLLTRLS